ncbi:hypothetical protein, partial [Streptomyces sp. MS191]|uniref:hypothetical protein n=1 Tax=Streptomyces sp. ms191 TaxID=1827978 RepID=UPI001C9C02CD
PLYERDGGHSRELHEAVEELIAAHGSDDVGDLVADAVAAGRIDRERGAALLNVAAWSGTDNGTALGRTLTGWLRAGDDAVRVHLALHHETFPFPTRGEMLARLPGLANRFAEHRALVERSLAGRPPRPAGAGPEVRVVLGEPTAQDTEAIVTVADEVPGCASGATVGRAAGPCRAQARARAGCVADGAGWPTRSRRAVARASTSASQTSAAVSESMASSTTVPPCGAS